MRHRVKKLAYTAVPGLLCLLMPLGVMAASMEDACKYIDSHKESILKDWVELVKIPAPSRFEQARAKWIKAKMEAAGLTGITEDSMHNVYGLFAGKSPSAPAVVLAAHLDTVFPMDTPINPEIKDGKLFAPGAGDCASNVVGTLYALKAIKEAGMTPNVNIVFLASAQEEIGNKGMKYFLDTYKKPIEMVIAVDSGLGFIAYGALGMQWHKLTFDVPAGHALSSPGKPSSAKTLGMVIDRLYKEIQIDPATLTIMNVGALGGGTTANSIATQSWMTVDLRSQSTDRLKENVRQTLAIAEQTAQNTGAKFTSELINDMPGGLLANADTHKLTVAAADAIKALGITPSLSPMGSCDSNASIAKGIYSIAIGVGRGGRRTLHSGIRRDRSCLHRH